MTRRGQEEDEDDKRRTRGGQEKDKGRIRGGHRVGQRGQRTTGGQEEDTGLASAAKGQQPGHRHQGCGEPVNSKLFVEWEISRACLGS